MTIKLDDQNLVNSTCVVLWSLSKEINVKKDFCFKTHDTTLRGKDRRKKMKERGRKKKENS